MNLGSSTRGKPQHSKVLRGLPRLTLTGLQKQPLSHALWAYFAINFTALKIIRIVDY